MDSMNAFNAMHKACGIGVGDKVKVVRDWRMQEFGVSLVGQGCVKLGAEGRVRDVDYDRDGILHFQMEGSYNIIPFFALQLVKKAKPAWKAKSVKISRDYLAQVNENNIVVGCQTITFDAFDELAKVVAEAKAHAAA